MTGMHLCYVRDNLIGEHHLVTSLTVVGLHIVRDQIAGTGNTVGVDYYLVLAIDYRACTYRVWNGLKLMPVYD